MDSFLNFKELLVLYILAVALSVGAQEKETKDEKPAYYYDVLGKVKAGLVFPSAYGDNFLAQNYDIRTGVHLDAMVKIDKVRDLGVQIQGIQGVVTNNDNLGLLESSTITSAFLVLGHTLLGRKNDLEFNANIGLGYIDFRNRVGLRRFNDSGTALMAGAELSYRLSNAFGIFIAAQSQWGFLRIDAAESVRGFLRNTRVFQPIFGIKFYIL
ncbi:MAG: hypothetical protein ACFB0A_06910 [Croceivirga sp.]